MCCSVFALVYSVCCGSFYRAWSHAQGSHAIICTENANAAAQENASKPEGLPPSQGGKYVGFGSGAPPARRGNPVGSSGLDDVSQVLTKGFSQLSTVAGAIHPFHLLSMRPYCNTLLCSGLLQRRWRHRSIQKWGMHRCNDSTKVQTHFAGPAS